MLIQHTVRKEFGSIAEPVVSLDLFWRKICKERFEVNDLVGTGVSQIPGLLDLEKTVGNQVDKLIPCD